MQIPSLVMLSKSNQHQISRLWCNCLVRQLAWLGIRQNRRRKNSLQITPITARDMQMRGETTRCCLRRTSCLPPWARGDTQTLTQAYMVAHAQSICCPPSPCWGEFKYNFIGFLQKALSCIICLDVVRVVPVGLAKLSRNSGTRVAKLKQAKSASSLHLFINPQCEVTANRVM